MEDMLGNWSFTKYTMLAARASLIELDDKLGGLEASFAWKNYVMGKRTKEALDLDYGKEKDGDAGATSTGGPVPFTLVDAEMAPFPIPMTMSPLVSKCVWKGDASESTFWHKTNSLPLKLPT